MVRRCSHCSFALLISFFIERCNFAVDGPEDFGPRVDTELKTGEPPCDS